MARLRNPALVQKPAQKKSQKPLQKVTDSDEDFESASEPESEAEGSGDSEEESGNSEDESLPDLEEILMRKPGGVVGKGKAKEAGSVVAPVRRRRIVESSDEEEEEPAVRKEKGKGVGMVPKAKDTPKRRQRVLGPVAVNTTLLQKLTLEESRILEKKGRRKEGGSGRQVLISRTEKKSRNARSSEPEKSKEVEAEVEEVEEVEEEESICCGTDPSDTEASETEAESKRSKPAPVLPKSRKDDKSKSKSLENAARSTSEPVSAVIDLTASPSPAKKPLRPKQLPRPVTLPNTANRPNSSSSNDHHAMLQYSPPRNYSPRKAAPDCSRPSTPPPAPASPSKSRLQSPSKAKPRIPTPPHIRPSLDAFWSADVINTWNDTYSPSKPLISPRKPKFLANNDSDDSPTSSPKKSRSPSKKADPAVAAARKARKDFETEKDTLAHAFLTELDALTTSSQIAALTASTGGTKIVWSKTLKTTAGRANWRRETFRTRAPDGTVETKYRNHASIELATKVIDNPDRLRNVLAHEFCHLATFMIDGQRTQPHGAEFKAWARKVGRLFGDQGIEVTTKHSYEIEFKFVWECEGCGYEFKRHSRSVDPARHTCGKCRGKLVQTRPVPRGKVVDGEEGSSAGGEYRAFVKENFGRVKKGLEERGAEAGMGKVMEVLGREYREKKAETVVKTKGLRVGESLRDVETAFEALTVAD